MTSTGSARCTPCPQLWSLAITVALLPATVLAQLDPGDLASAVDLGPGSGGFAGTVDDGDQWSAALAPLGDIDGDGVPDVAVGAPGDDDGGPQHGAIWVLFMAADGTVGAHSKISATSGGFGGTLTNNVAFGHALACPGDVNGDGIADLAVGSPRDADGGSKHGAVWILFLDADGTVTSEQKISALQGGFMGELDNGDEFGRSVSAAGDVDGDGVPDLAVGALNDDDGNQQVGAVWILFLNADGTVREHGKISGTTGGFGGDLDNNDEFGRSISSIGDLDGNGVADLAVGALNDGDGGPGRGAVWLLMLAADGTVTAEHKISSISGGFVGPLADGDAFGRSVAGVGDLDGNGTRDLLVGAPGDDVAGPERGAAWLLLLAPDGSVMGQRRYEDQAEPLIPMLSDGGAFGLSLAVAGDVDGNGADDWMIGSPLSDTARGEARLLLLDSEDAPEPYLPSAAIFDGKPGRAILVDPDPEGAGSTDFIDEPVIVASNTSGAGVNVRIGVQSEGETGFLSEQDIPTGENPVGLNSGNFSDGSGLIAALEDVVVANRGSDDFSFLRGLPDGSFAAAVNYSLLPDNAAPLAVEVGDFDLDGHLDAALAGDAGVSVFSGDGTGQFGPPMFTPLLLLTDIRVGLLNGDAIPDLMCTSGRFVTPAQPTEEGFATVLLGNGDGSFSVASTFASGTAQASALLGDVDQDGDLDALLVSHALDDGAGNGPQGRIDLYEGDGLGGFSASPSFAGYASTSAQGIHPLYGSLGDLDGDGTLDAVFSSSDNIAFEPGTFADEQPPVTLTVLKGDGAGSFDVKIVGTAYAGKGVDPILADIHPDVGGLPDAILVWYEDIAAGLEGQPEQLVTFVTAFTADGEAGFFDPSSSQFDVGDEPSDASIADVNPPLSDSDTAVQQRLDVVVPNLGDNSLSILLGDGEGAIRSEIVIEDVGPYTLADLPAGEWVGGLRAVRTGDLSGDGVPDALISAWFEDQSEVSPDPRPFASLVRLDGAQASVVQVVPLDRTGELALGDLSGDGRPDGVVAARVGLGETDAVLLFEAAHDGSIPRTPQVLPLPEGLRLSGGLELADLTGDGRIDVVTTALGPLDEGLLLVIDPVDGTSATTTLHPTWGEVRSVALGDLTGDGLTDAAVGLEDGRLFVARGLGGAAFVPLSIDPQSAAVGGGALAMADVDGDGRVDLLSSSATDDGDIDQAFVRLLLGTQATGIYAIQNVDALQSTGLVGAITPRVADMNGDGAVDLVLVHGTSDRISILVNQLSRFEAYGAGKAGSGGFTPVLASQGFSTPGGQFELQLCDAVGGAPGLLQLGVGRVETGFLHVGSVALDVPVSTSGTPGDPGAGSWSLPLVTPDDADLVGLEVTFQVLLLDQGAGPPAPTKLAASNGLAMIIVQ